MTFPLRGRIRSLGAYLGLGMALLFLLGGAALELVHAEDDAEPVPLAAQMRACQEALKTHYRARDGRAMLADVQSALALYQAASAEGGCEKAKICLVQAVGKLCKFKSLEIQQCAIRGLGTMGHEAGAPFLKRYLKPVGKRKPKNYDAICDAIEASGSVAHYSLIRPLVVMVDKSKNTAIATKAMGALGKFSGCKRHRCKILTDLMKSLRPHMPGRAAPGKENESTGAWIPGKSGNAGTSRWGALSPVLVTTFNELTGQNIMAAEDWFQYVQDNKQNLKSIFRDES